jgi:hypothetical protein
MSFLINNKEAFGVWQRAVGTRIVSLMSGNYFSILQRNLDLDFLLHDSSSRGLELIYSPHIALTTSPEMSV